MQNTERFSNRVDDYVRYRPSYPPEIVDLLVREMDLTPQSRVADIGYGTGLLTELFLRFGCEVFAVEPNAPMRAAGERRLQQFPRFHSSGGVAEQTDLPPASVDLVVAGQAFHWFDVTGSHAEFHRILRPHGGVALIWNTRRDDATAFLRGYEASLQKYARGYAEVDHRRVGRAAMDEFFGLHRWKRAVFPNEQLFDWEGLIGRVRSSSYAPHDGTDEWQFLEAELRDLFHREAQGDKVAFLYETEVYYGKL
jgi:SAM-dependent methyltransferase